MAERKGFEPPRPFQVYLLSKQASSTTPAPLHLKSEPKIGLLFQKRKKILSLGAQNSIIKWNNPNIYCINFI